MRNFFWLIILVIFLMPMVFAYAHTEGEVEGEVVEGETHNHLVNPLRFGKISDLIAAILDALVKIGLPIAAVFIVYSGFLYVKAQGNPDALKKAHQALIWTLVGTAVLLAATLFSGIIATTIDQLKP